MTRAKGWVAAFVGACGVTAAVWPADRAVSKWFEAHRIAGMNAPALAITSAWTLTSVVVVGCVWLASRNRWRACMTVAAVTLGTLGIGSILKVVIGRHRPYESIVDFVALTEAADASFPSNHTSAAFAACILLGTALPWVRIPLALVAATVACTRLYVGVHYLSDICGGLALAIATAGIGMKWLERREPLPADPGEPAGQA